MIKAPRTVTSTRSPTPQTILKGSQAPAIHSTSPSPPSRPNLAKKPSLLDLGDWVFEDGSPPRRNRQADHISNGQAHDPPTSHTNLTFDQNSVPKSNTPLINLESPPKPKHDAAPPLPPRKPSYSSLKSTSSGNSVSARSAASTSSLQLPKPSGSLMIEHTYPPLSKINVTGIHDGKGHAPASSISSFHSVSLSSDENTPEASTPAPYVSSVTAEHDRGDDDTISLDESFENVSASSVISPTSASSAANWEKSATIRKPPPQLPRRPSQHKLTGSPTPSLVPLPNLPSLSYTARRPAPPPPVPVPLSFSSAIPPLPESSGSRTSMTASDRASIRSTASRVTTINNNGKSQLSRPTPIPPIVRKRYEAVFAANVIQQRRSEELKDREKRDKQLLTPPKRSRQAAGWRGLSVDLIMSPESPPLGHETGDRQEVSVDGTVDADDWIDGSVVRVIWGASNLDKGKLKAIWNECDPTRQGTLDRDAFVRGMWRIDEELRKSRHPSSSANRHRPPSKPAKLILR